MGHPLVVRILLDDGGAQLADDQVVPGERGVDEVGVVLFRSVVLWGDVPGAAGAVSDGRRCSGVAGPGTVGAGAAGA